MLTMNTCCTFSSSVTLSFLVSHSPYTMPKAASPFRTMSVQTAEYSFMRLTLNSSGGVSSSFCSEGGSFMKRPMVTATVMLVLPIASSLPKL